MHLGGCGKPRLPRSRACVHLGGGVVSQDSLGPGLVCILGVWYAKIPSVRACVHLGGCGTPRFPLSGLVCILGGMVRQDSLCQGLCASWGVW